MIKAENVCDCHAKVIIYKLNRNYDADIYMQTKVTKEGCKIKPKVSIHREGIKQ